MNGNNRLPMAIVMACWYLAAMTHGQGYSESVPGDEIWLVSARNLAEGCTGGFQYQKLCGGVWQHSTCHELLEATAQNPHHAQIVFVHGYQTNLHYAQTRGIQVYHNLFSDRCQDRPIRYVIWAWKSERETKRVVKEFTAKARHAMQLGDALATTLNQLKVNPPTVIAYSLGAQVSISALVQSSVYAGAPVKLAVIAAATDCGFSSCCLQMQNCGNIARSLVFSNRGDLAIRAARMSCRLARGRRPETLEQVAPCFPAQLGEVDIVDITACSSRKHSIVRYTSLPMVIQYINELVGQAACPPMATPTEIGQAVEFFREYQLAEQRRTQNVCVMR